MTYWKPGRKTEWGRKCTSSWRAEYSRYLIEAGICEGDIFYVVHYWKGSKTLHTKPAMLIPEHFINADDIQIFRLSKDGKMQVQFLVEDQTKWFYVDAADLKEIKDLEIELNGSDKIWFPSSPHMPDLSYLHPNIRIHAKLLWDNYHKEYGPGPNQTLWKHPDAIRNHALIVYKLSEQQVDEILNLFWTGGPQPSKLKILEGVIFFYNAGTVAIIPIGKSWRNVLNWDENHDWHNWHPTVRNLADYEKVIMNSGQNYERINIKHKNGIADIEGTKNHSRKVYEKGIIVELTIDGGKTFKIKNWKEAVDELGKEPNVILQTNNEFLDDWDLLKETLERANYVVDKGFIASGGGWGYSHHGEDIAEEFSKVSPCQIWSVHRGPYPPLSSWQEYIKKAKKSGKAVLCDELLVHDPHGEHGWKVPGAPWQELEQYVSGALDAGANGVNVYCGLANYSYFKLMGDICKTLNPF